MRTPAAFGGQTQTLQVAEGGVEQRTYYAPTSKIKSRSMG
jgi:hypothetical protein